MKLGLIYARSRNGIIGKDGAMPWHLPEDLAHFKRTTMGSPVIMGRKTWDSVPERFRPLPGRLNVVVTRQPQWSAAGALRAGALQEAIELCAGHERAWVIGGGELYAQAVALADLAEVTEVDADIEGDVRAPVLDSQWREVARNPQRSASGLPLAFVTYRRAG
jgi:dihydrofolate reductase